MNDQELDNLLRRLTQDSGLDDATTEDIAGSPNLWWNIQRNTRSLKPEKAPWPPSILRRWLAIGLPVAAAVLLAVIFFGTVSKRTTDIAETRPSPADISNEVAIEQTPAIIDKTVGTAKVVYERPATRSRPTVAKPTVVRAGSPRQSLAVAKRRTESAAEVKSDFIALAYAREPESGQLVRVKVPSSMMVTLGVVPTVDKPSELVDAEVIVGDDGLTHAIRFIRQ